MNGPIVTERFRLRPLSPDDASERYLSWFSDGAVKRNILYASGDLTDLRRYIAEKAAREDVLFLGIFSLENGEHIGNVKFEPVDPKNGFAVMGILIGEPSWRGKNVAGEVLRAAAAWLREKRGIHRIVLAVSKANEAAIRAYRKLGFETTSGPLRVDPAKDLCMTWELDR